MLRQATDTVLRPGAHGGAQPGKGRNLVVAGTCFSWDEQSNLVAFLQEQAVQALAEASDLSRDTAQRCSAVVGQWAFQTEKQYHGDVSPCRLQQITSLCPGVRL